MATKIVGFDSDFDKTSQLVSDWRRANVYKQFTTDGHTVVVLKGNLASRMYLQRELLKDGVGFLSGSGHGLFNELQGSDGMAALVIGGYTPAEVKGKVIHLLSCSTAFELGLDVVLNGCKAFFGYDVPFTFYIESMDAFMAPDAELDFALSEGASAEETHERVIKAYDKKIKELQAAGRFQFAAVMAVNLDHFCSAVKHEQWGQPSATI